MATVPEKDARPKFLDKAELRAALDEAYARMGFVPDPNATAERARELMKADGVRPEENLFSRGIIAMREE